MCSNATPITTPTFVVDPGGEPPVETPSAKSLIDSFLYKSLLITKDVLINYFLLEL